MDGNLERDRLGNILCDKCGKQPKEYTFKSSQLARAWIGAPMCKRKLIHLCVECARRLSAFSGGEYLK